MPVFGYDVGASFKVDSRSFLSDFSSCGTLDFVVIQWNVSVMDILGVLIRGVTLFQGVKFC